MMYGVIRMDSHFFPLHFKCIHHYRYLVAVVSPIWRTILYSLVYAVYFIVAFIKSLATVLRLFNAFSRELIVLFSFPFYPIGIINCDLSSVLSFVGIKYLENYLENVISLSTFIRERSYRRMAVNFIASVSGPLNEINQLDTGGLLSEAFVFELRLLGEIVNGQNCL